MIIPFEIGLRYLLICRRLVINASILFSDVLEEACLVLHDLLTNSASATWLLRYVKWDSHLYYIK